jgi:hypothetical protein
MDKLRLLAYVFFSSLGGGILHIIMPSISQVEGIIYLMTCAILGEVLSWKYQDEGEKNE